MSNVYFPVLEFILTLKNPTDYTKGAINVLGHSHCSDHYSYITVNECELGYMSLTETSIKVELITRELSRFNETIKALFGSDLNEWIISEATPEEEVSSSEEPVEELTEESVQEPEPTEPVEELKPYGLKGLNSGHEKPGHVSLGDKDGDGNIYMGHLHHEDHIDLLFITRVQHSATGRNDDALPTQAELRIILTNVFSIRGIMDPDKKLPVIGHHYWTKDNYLQTKGITVKIDEKGSLYSENYGRSTQLGRLEIKRVRIGAFK
jgi:hypothetical protein